MQVYKRFLFLQLKNTSEVRLNVALEFLSGVLVHFSSF